MTLGGIPPAVNLINAMRDHAILFSYYFFFILVPTATLFALFGLSGTRSLISVGGFIMLVFIGERCLPRWKRFWTKNQS
jgi:hypothetical protein